MEHDMPVFDNPPDLEDYDDSYVAGLLESSNRLRGWSPPEHKVPEVSVALRGIAKVIADERQRIEKEAVSELRGKEGEKVAVVGAQKTLTSVPKYDLMYNHGRIFVDLLDHEDTVMDVLTSLIDSGALVLDWKVTRLEPLLARYGVDITRSSSPVSGNDLDEAHVGKKLQRYKTGDRKGEVIYTVAVEDYEEGEQYGDIEGSVRDHGVRGFV